MKKRLIYFFAIVPLFAACSLLEDATDVTISTGLKADIPVVVTATGTKSVAAVSFTKSQDLSLSSNSDVEPYLAKIKEVNLKSLVITVNGLSTGQTINTVSLDVTGVGNIFTQTNIAMTNNSFTPSIAAATLKQVGAKFLSEKKITLTLSGNASGPMTFTVNLNFDTDILANPLK